MRVLVLNPASAYQKNVIRDVLYGCWCAGKRIGGGTVPPFALLNIATILKNEGHDVLFMDAQAEQTPFSDVKSHAPDLDAVVISTSTMTFQEDADTLQALKDENRSLKTIAFGSHPTFLPQSAMAHGGLDIGVRSEPEYIVRDVVAGMRNGNGDWKAVNGIVYKESDEVVINPGYPYIDMNELPFPDTSMLPKDIHYYNPLVKRMPYITTTTSKGCPAKCTFCTAPWFDGLKVRFQSAEYVLNEIEYFIDQGYKEVYFRDDTFFVWKKRDIELCQQIVKRGLDVTWIANARVSMIDKEMMQLAHDAGCHTIKFGIESGVQEILDRMNKGYKVEQAYQVFEWIHEVGIHAHAHVMLGNPGDSAETIERTIQYVKELAPATATFGICTPYPGTPLFAEVAEKFPEIKDGTNSDFSKLHVEGLYNEHYTSLTQEELKGYVQKAYRSFYARPTYIAKTARQQLRGMDDVKRLSIAASNVLDFALRGA